MKLEEILLFEKISEIENLKKNKVKLSPEEREEVLKNKAVWHHGLNGKESPAIWKSKIGNKFVYVTNTHRAYAKASTLKGAIKKYHKVIKGTA
jgi:hypothetical protein